MTAEEKFRICELYKAYYTAKEMSKLMNVSYNTISIYFAAYRKLDVKRYDRSIFLDEEEFAYGKASNE